MVVVNYWLLYKRAASAEGHARNDIFSLASFKIQVDFGLMKAGKKCESVMKGRPSSASQEPTPKHRRFEAVDSALFHNVDQIPAVDGLRNRCKRNGCTGRTNI